MSGDGRGEYRSTYVVLLDSPEFLALTPPARFTIHTLKLVLGRAGIDVVRPGTLESGTGMPTQMVERALLELEHPDLGPWIRRQANVIWLRNALRYEPSMNLKNDRHRTSIRRHVEGLPKLRIVNEFAEHYGLEKPWTEEELEPPSHQVGLWDGSWSGDTLSKGYPEGIREGSEGGDPDGSGTAAEADDGAYPLGTPKRGSTPGSPADSDDPPGTYPLDTPSNQGVGNREEGRGKPDSTTSPSEADASSVEAAADSSGALIPVHGNGDGSGYGDLEALRDLYDEATGEARRGRLTQLLTGYWIKRFQAYSGGQRPSESQVKKHASIFRRVCKANPPNVIFAAALGIEQVAPHVMGEPWDAMDFERKLTKAQGRWREHPVMKELELDRALDRALDDVNPREEEP